jgi:hypothetical protein
LPFNILPDTPDLRSADAELLIDAIEANGGADVIVIDTLAQATSGADENSGQDMGPVLAKCSAMIERLGATVVLVHHSGKDASRGSRGWSGIKGALDTELHVVRHETHSSISVTKQKDGPEGKTISFELQPVELGFDAEGDPVVSRTVRHLNAAEVSKDDPKGKWQTRIYDELLALEGFGSVQRESLLAAVIIRQAADYPNEQPVRKDALLRSLRKLITRGTVVLQDGCVSSTSTTKTHNR